MPRVRRPAELVHLVREFEAFRGLVRFGVQDSHAVLLVALLLADGRPHGEVAAAGAPGHVDVLVRELDRRPRPRAAFAQVPQPYRLVRRERRQRLVVARVPGELHDAVAVAVELQGVAVIVLAAPDAARPIIRPAREFVATRVPGELVHVARVAADDFRLESVPLRNRVSRFLGRAPRVALAGHGEEALEVGVGVRGLRVAGVHGGHRAALRCRRWARQRG
mmetsp:Transcript_10927/g.28757  ORF Transcript_10927/g.28757 Transcript_10927/m.28757 type:complete len:221 (+) Transcript_10927:411-1073(+)